MSKIIVIKIGGSFMQYKTQLESLIISMDKLINVGTKFVIVHGGGPQADILNEKLGIPIKKVDGRRITDNNTLETVKMVYNGLLNTDLVAICEKFGIEAVGISGIDAHTALVTKRPIVNGIDFGYVGDIEKISIGLIKTLLNNHYIPVISCLGIDGNGQVLNINADTLATQTALSLGAKKIIYITDVKGVYKKGETELIDKLTVSDAIEFIKNGTITKGMIPKIENIAEAIKVGIKEILIVGGLDDKKEWIDAIENNSYGTTIVPN